MSHISILIMYLHEIKNQRRALVQWLLSAIQILFVLIVSKADMTVFVMQDSEEKETHAMILMNVPKVQIVLWILNVQIQ